MMFCDLVGSTALSERLDPEELRELMEAYRKAGGEVVAHYEGHVAQYLGDGLMVYFGWPQRARGRCRARRARVPGDRAGRKRGECDTSTGGSHWAGYRNGGSG